MAQSPATPEVRIDLYRDWVEGLRQRLVDRGYAVEQRTSAREIANAWFNVGLRDISPRPRVVKRSLGFSAPASQAAALAEIERKSLAGEVLRPYLSKKLLKADFHDPLLNDWGIHHLHLGTAIGPDGFVERTGPLLFAIVGPDVLYFIAVKEHGTWTDKTLLEEVLRSWPHLLAPYEMPGVEGSDPDFSAEGRHILRKKHLLVLTELSNGKVYAPPGGGYSSSGHNFMIVVHCTRWARFLEWIEEDVLATLESKRAALPAGTTFGSPPTFQLMMDPSGDPVVVELTARQGYRYLRHPLLIWDPAA